MNEENKKIKCKDHGWFSGDLQLSLGLSLNNGNDQKGCTKGMDSDISTKLSLALTAPHSSSTAT